MGDHAPKASFSKIEAGNKNFAPNQCFLHQSKKEFAPLQQTLRLNCSGWQGSGKPEERRTYFMPFFLENCKMLVDAEVDHQKIIKVGKK